MPIPNQVHLKAPWRTLSQERAEIMRLQLQREIAPGHVLYGADVIAVAERIDRDDVLFELTAAETQLAQVHLTWHKNPQRNPYPITKLLFGWEGWVHETLLPDCEEHRGS